MAAWQFSANNIFVGQQFWQNSLSALSILSSASMLNMIPPGTGRARTAFGRHSPATVRKTDGSAIPCRCRIGSGKASRRLTRNSTMTISLAGAQALDAISDEALFVHGQMMNADSGRKLPQVDSPVAKLQAFPLRSRTRVEAPVPPAPGRIFKCTGSEMQSVRASGPQVGRRNVCGHRHFVTAAHQAERLKIWIFVVTRVHQAY